MIRYTVAITMLLILQSKELLSCKKATPPTIWDTTVKPLTSIDNDVSKEIIYVNLTLIKNHMDRNVNFSWGGWSPPPQVIKEWRDWLYEWESKTNNTDILVEGMDKKKKKDLLAERGPGSGWPITWLDLGVGQGGAAPPPWSYVPRHTGKNSYCFLPPRYGRCQKQEKRWGFNPYSNQCEEFTYSGCGGNGNNFIVKEKCEDMCMGPAPSGCDLESHIVVQDLLE